MTTTSAYTSAGLFRKVTATQTLLICITLTIGAKVHGQPLHGGFGNFLIGTTYNITSIENDLMAHQILGPSLQLNTNAITIGGSGYSLKPNGFLLGGSGYFYHITSPSEKGDVKLQYATGFFNIGYCLTNNQEWIGFPYFGMGAFGSSLKVTNVNPDAFLLLGTDTISSSKQAEYTTGGMAFDIGFAIKHFTWKMHDGETKAMLITGADAGISVFPAFYRWENITSHQTLNTIKAPFTIAPYFRVTIGLGILKTNN